MLKHADDTELCWKNLLNLSHSIITCHIELIQWNGEKVHYLESNIFCLMCHFLFTVIVKYLWDTENIEDVSAEKCRKETFPSCNVRKNIFFSVSSSFHAVHTAKHCRVKSWKRKDGREREGGWTKEKRREFFIYLWTL